MLIVVLSSYFSSFTYVPSSPFKLLSLSLLYPLHLPFFNSYCYDFCHPLYYPFYMLLIVVVLLILLIWLTMTNNVLIALLNFLAYACVVIFSFMSLSTAFSFLL